MQLTITIPENVKPGQIIAMKTDGGQVVHVPVPEDAVAGQTIKFTVNRNLLGADFKDDEEKDYEEKDLEAPAGESEK